MEKILHQLICGLSHYLQGRVLYIPGGAGILPSTDSRFLIGNQTILEKSMEESILESTGIVEHIV